ncbi:MAG: SHOCT domain-containing protein [Nitrospirae bacterium]|nr:MAG: SHOCT domain-containing protein [Nitrospirota bacterium]
MHGSGFGMGFGGFGLGWLFMILFWGIIILTAVYLIKTVFADKKDGSDRSAESAEEILKKRLAAGEINAKEYEEKLKILRERG